MNTRRAVVAGIIGGIVVDLFLVIVRAVPFPGVYQFIASTLVGPVAYTSTAYIVLGLALHFFISIVSALVFAFVAARSRVLIENPTLWGAIFGLGVMLVMQLVTRIAHAAPPPTVTGITISLVAHVVFFGLPVAWYIALGEKRQTLAA